MRKIIDKILDNIDAIFLCGVAIALIVIIAVTMLTAPVQESEPTEPTELVLPTYHAMTTVLDRRFTAPDTYELLYRTVFENGLTADIWRKVTREEYYDVGRGSLE